MSDDSFSKSAAYALAVSVIVHVIQLLSAANWPLILLANLCCLVFLRQRAMTLAREGREDFDPVIAAEVIVAFGVLSLIFGLATSLAPLLFTDLTFEWAVLRRLSLPFIEGLGTAGAAPFFAVLLRLQAFEISRTLAATDDIAGLAAATRDLTGELRRAGKSANELQAALLAAGTSTASMAREVDTHGGLFGAALLESQGHVRALTAAAQAGSVEMNKLATETDRLKGAAGDAGTMLGELSALIDTVKRFVSPDPAAKRR